MTGNGTIWWYGIGLRPGQIERLARHPGWEPAGLSRTAQAVPDPREPVDVWLVQAPDLAEALRCGRLVRSRHGEGALWLLVPPEAPADVWEAAAGALLGTEPAVRVITSLDRALEEPGCGPPRVAPGQDRRPAGTAAEKGHHPAPPRRGATAGSPLTSAGSPLTESLVNGRPAPALKPPAGPGSERLRSTTPPEGAPTDGAPQAGRERAAGSGEPPPGPGANRQPHAALDVPLSAAHLVAGGGPEDAVRSPAATGMLLVVAGAKGGVGRTWLACELAVAAAARGLRAALVDAHFVAADVTVALDLPAGPTILDLQPLLDGPEEAWTDQWLVHPRSGLRVLAAPPRPDLAALVEPDTLDRVLQRALAGFDLVVVDSPAGPAWPVAAGLEHEPRWELVVTTADAAALRRTRLWLEEGALRGGPGGPWGVVVNRWSGPEASRAEAERYLGVQVAAWIPDDAAAVQQAAAAGLPLVLSQPAHPVAQEVVTLLGALLGQPAEAPRGGPLSRLWHRWRAAGRRPRGTASEGVTFRAG